MQTKGFLALHGDVLLEVNAVIDAANKRRGCRGMVEKERRFFHSSCCIM